MIDPLQASMRMAGSGLQAQSIRMRVISENIANAFSTGASSADEPYRRKTVTFGDELSRQDGMKYVAIKKIGQDDTSFRIVREPGNPAADAKGNVRMPNVEPILEMADMREANHGYQASLQVIKQSREMLSMTLDMLKG